MSHREDKLKQMAALRGQSRTLEQKIHSIVRSLQEERDALRYRVDILAKKIGNYSIQLFSRLRYC